MGSVRLQQTLKELKYSQRVVVKNGEDTLYDGKAINAISTDLAYQYQV